MTTADRSRLHKGVLEALDTGLVVVDADELIACWNDWMIAAAGIPAASTFGKRLEDVFPGAHLVRVKAAIAEALKSGASSFITHALNPNLLPLRTRVGRPMVHNVAVRPVGERPYLGCIVQVFDVTAPTEREQVLRKRQNARYDAVVDSAPDPILTIDAQGLIQLANPAAARELGYAPEDLIGSPVSRFLEQSDAWDEAWRAVWAGEPATWPIEMVALRRDGTRSFVDASASRWFSGAGTFVTAILRDVNERRAAEDSLRLLNDTLEEKVRERTAELERAHEQLRQSQKVEAIGQLTGGIAHDFNNLLTPIVGGLDILQRRGVGDERGQRLIDGALQSAERARILVQRLLAFARRQPLQPSPVDIGKVIGDMTDLVGATLGPRIRLVMDVAPGLPPAMGDPNQLEMALLNLAVNARDAMPDGGTITIGGRMTTSAAPGASPPGKYIVLSVADTGIGMDAETLSRAVEPFYSTKGIGKGTGLGLSMIHGLAAQLGGWLDLASTPGVGTRVEMWLPVADGPVVPVIGPPNGGEHNRGAGLVLLVDDEDLIRAATSQMLADLGYTVVEASSAKEAIRHIADPRLTLVVTDHLMPGMTGTELARQIQAIAPRAPILIISGYAELEDIAPDLPRLMKPFREFELAAAIASLK